jgi:hypothetical protein
MSAETTNIDKQVKRHRPALWGMGLAAAAVALLFLAFLAAVVGTPQDDVEEAITTEQTGS